MNDDAWRDVALDDLHRTERWHDGTIDHRLPPALESPHGETELSCYPLTGGALRAAPRGIRHCLLANLSGEPFARAPTPCRALGGDLSSNTCCVHN
jgi:hypothetical protein